MSTRYGSCRFIATEASGKGMDGVEKGVVKESTQTTKSEKTSQTPIQKSGRKGDRRKGQGERRRMKPKTNSAAATAASVQTNTSPSNDGNESGDKDIEIVATRLVDNHPITPKDRDPRYYLSHLTEDKLEDNVPVFESDRAAYPDEFSRDVRVSSVDENGNEVVEIRHLTSNKEEGLRELGFTPATDDMFGYHYGTNLLPGVNIEDSEDDKGLASVSKSILDDGTSNETPEEDETTKMPANHEYRQIDEEALRWFGTPILPGSDMQMELENERMIHQAYAQDIRKEHRQMVLGYDNRDYNNSQPWVDTHRMEAIDARLHEVHLQRAAGELDYPIEKDAAVEAHRIFEEEEAALNTIEAIVNAPTKKVQTYSTNGQSHIRKNRSMKKKSIASDKDLETMAVDAIPIEKLYEARRIELEKLRSTHYEDYDLNYLMEKSGKELKSKRNVSSLYEKQYGNMNSPSEWEEVNPVLGVKYLKKDLSDEEKAILQQEVQLYRKYGRLSLESSLGLYNRDVNVISPEMIESMKTFCNMSDEKEDNTPGLSSDLFNNDSATHYKMKDMETRVKEEEKYINTDIAVDPEMADIHGDSTRPLEDIEVGLNKNKDLVFAHRLHPSSMGEYQKEKLMFMKKFDEMLNQDLKEGDKEQLKDMVFTQEDIEQARSSVGLPADLSNKDFYKKYLRSAKRSKNAGDIVSDIMTGYSISNPDKMLKDMKLETEQDVEDYLMDTFKSHKATQEQLMSPEEREAYALLQETSRVANEAEKLIKEAKEKEAQPKAEGEAKPEGEAKAEGEAKPEGEAKQEGDAKTEEPKAEESKPEEVKPEGEAKTEESKPEGEAKTEEAKPEDPFNKEANFVDPYQSMTPEEAINTMWTRAREDQDRANAVVSSNPNPLMRGHIVDALEYSDQVYVHEKTIQLMYKMYNEGMSPKEISQTFGFDEGRVYGYLRLMKRREIHKKEGAYSDKLVDDIEATEDVFNYEYRDFPPANFKKLERRKMVSHIPKNLPKFVFLKEGDDEEKVMKEVDRLITKKKQMKQPSIKRKELPVGGGKVLI